LTDVWEGFTDHRWRASARCLQRTFGNLGAVWENIKGIGSGLMELAAAIAKLMSIGNGSGEGFAKWLGELAGGFSKLAALGLEGLSQSLWIMSGAIRSTILDLLNGKTLD